MPRSLAVSLWVRRAAMVALEALRTHKETAKERGISLEQIYS